MIRDKNQKLRLYERFGVPEYWITDQEEDRALLYRMSEGRYPEPLVLEKGSPLSSPFLPGLSIPLSAIFPS